MLDEYKKCIEACYLCATACDNCAASCLDERESGDDARVHKTGYAVCKYLPSCSSIHDTK
jgi:hypothetical protein